MATLMEDRPDLNRIENLWAIMKQAVEQLRRNRMKNSSASFLRSGRLEMTLIESMSRRKPDWIKFLTTGEPFKMIWIYLGQRGSFWRLLYIAESFSFNLVVWEEWFQLIQFKIDDGNVAPAGSFRHNLSCLLTLWWSWTQTDSIMWPLFVSRCIVHDPQMVVLQHRRNRSDDGMLLADPHFETSGRTPRFFSNWASRIRSI
jgi:hypothetical protein